MAHIFYSPLRAIFGVGCAATLGEQAKSLGARKVLLVTDKVIRRKTENVDNALANLRAQGIAAEVFDDVEHDPLVATAQRSVEYARAFQPDAVVGLGGGSSLDIAKATAVFLTNGATPLSQMWGVENIPQPALPLILLPTTGGTGSEASRHCVLTDIEPDGSHKKKSIVSSKIIARVAIIDPSLMVTAPPALTAATGMDALTHAIETYVSREAQPLTDPLALEAVRLISQYLRRATANGQDIEARSGMANAAYMAGLAFSNGQLGIVHAVAMVLGSRFNIPHGVANALMLPYVMEFNEMAATSRFAQIARALGEHIEQLSERDAAHRATTAVHRLMEDLSLPRRLGDVGVT